MFGVQTIDTLRHEAYEARQLGQYRLKERIGAGGMGEVYKAEHQLLKRPCVIKLIKPEKAGDARVLARFKREVRATSKLTHWNTIAIYDYGSTSDGVFYYVMEYLPGMSLSELVKRYGPMPPERVIHVLRQACEALAEAHGQGLVHRDIKPGNIFLAERGGVHRRGQAARLRPGQAGPGRRRPAPDDRGLDHRLAAVHVARAGHGRRQARRPQRPLLAGRGGLLPLDRQAAVRGRPADQGDHGPRQPGGRAAQQALPRRARDLEQIILKCLAKKPEDRFQTAAEMADALDACEAAHQWTRRQAAQWWREHPRPDEPVQLERARHAGEGRSGRKRMCRPCRPETDSSSAEAQAKRTSPAPGARGRPEQAWSVEARDDGEGSALSSRSGPRPSSSAVRSVSEVILRARRRLRFGNRANRGCVTRLGPAPAAIRRRLSGRIMSAFLSRRARRRRRICRERVVSMSTESLSPDDVREDLGRPRRPRGRRASRRSSTSICIWSTK